MLNEQIKIILLIGESGSGKTHLFKRIKKLYENSKTIFEPDLVYEKLHRFKNLFMLGNYNDCVLPNTEPTNMTLSTIEKFLNKMRSGSILIEGDKYTNREFIDFCQRRFQLEVFILANDRELCAERRLESGKNYSQIWLKCRRKKMLLLDREYKPQRIYSSSDVKTEKALLSLVNAYSKNYYELLP